MWCEVDHDIEHSSPRRPLHFSAITAQPISIRERPEVSESYEISVTYCDLETVDGETQIEVVEIAHYRGQRYSVTALTPPEARRLAELLRAAADQCDGEQVAGPVVASYRST
jgi:hypothetical protein